MQSIETSTETTELLRTIEQSVSLGAAPWAETLMSGPFRMFLEPTISYNELNYAMPVAPLGTGEELLAAVRDLRAVFAERGRRMRLEFTEELWPDLASALEGEGLRAEGREPVMACTRDEFQPVAVPGISLRALGPDDPDADLAAYITIRDEEERVPGADEVGRLRGAIARSKGWFLLASIEGQSAGTGRLLVSPDGLGEITAIVTRADQRRRGVAATVVSSLVRRCFAEEGKLAWLTAANPPAQSVYTRLGFRMLGTLASYEEPAG
jgi:ribosomal protein S18 acetylase RimI-like enzyme